MSGDSGEEKNLTPTDHHLRKLREKGNFPLSDDFHSAVAAVSKVLLLYLGATTAGAAMEGLLETAFVLPASSAGLAKVAKDALYLLLTVFLLISGLSIVAYVGARAIDGGGLKAHFEKVSFKLSNLNPAVGIKNKFKLRGLLELFKGIAKVAILGAGFGYIVRPHVAAILNTAGCDLHCGGVLVGDLVLKFILLFLAVQIAAAALDIKLVRQVFKIENKMSHSDRKREGRDVDGDPDVKQEQSSFRKSLLDSSAPQQVANGQEPGAMDAGRSGQSPPSDDSERRIVVFADGQALTISINFTGEFKALVIDSFAYRGDVPPKASDSIGVQDPVSVQALSKIGVGRSVPMHVLKRLMDVMTERGGA